MALSNLLFPIIQGMLNVPGSLHFLGTWGTDLPISAETFLPMLIRSLPLSFRLLVHNSFKNLAFLGIFFIASNKGMLTSTFLNVSKISFSASSIFLLETALGGNGRGGMCCFYKSELPVEDSPAQKLLGKFLSLPFFGVE